MIEGQGVVVSVADNGDIWVQVHRQSSCHQCSDKQSCGTAAIAKWVDSRQAVRVKAIARCAVQVGDQVSLVLKDGVFLKSVLAVYLVPLATMLLAAIISSLVFTDQGAGWVPIFSIAGLALGYLWLKVYAKRIQGGADFQPIIKQVLPSRSSV